MTGHHVTLSEVQILFGFRSDQMDKKEVQIINHLVLITKMVISKYKYGTAVNINVLFEYDLRLRNFV